MTQKQFILERKAKMATLRAEIAKLESALGTFKAEIKELHGVTKAEQVLLADERQIGIDRLKLELAKTLDENFEPPVATTTV